MKLFKIVIFFFLSILIISCSKKDDIPTDIQIQNFVWKGLNAYYLWQKEVNDLSDRRFSSDDELNNYLSDYDNPENLFNNLLHIPNEYPKDPNKTYSWIVDDYIALEQSFQGTRLTTGMKVKGADFADGSGYYVFVYDVVKNSDAETKGITRGMIITEVNGTILTPNNVNDLFANDSFTIHLADFNAGNPISNGTTINLVKNEVIENPIKETKIINEGSHTIGYLLYNQFSSNFDNDLNLEFANYKNQGITDLIIDLRYNGGGSVKTTTYLASMITGQFKDELFSKEIWNSKVMANSNSDNFINNFTDKIVNKDEDGNPIIDVTINSLNLKTIYFIVSENTASASELIINGLKPYINVKLVGTQTYGKHVGSITLYDSENFSKNGPNFRKNHTYAMQPIVLEIQNKNSENKPEGFIPDIIINEDPSNLGILGDVDEPLLQRTIKYITTGSKGFSINKAKTNMYPTWNSSMANPDYNNMYIKLK